MRMMRAIGGPVLSCFLLLSSTVWGQEKDARGAAREAARVLSLEVSLKTPGWKTEFLEALLGKNHAASQPQISALLQAVVASPHENAHNRAFQSFKGDPALLTDVLNVAAWESRIWKPGQLIRREALNKLWGLLYRGPPEGRRQYRIEGYSIPAPVSGWLLEEQKVNDHVGNTWKSNKTKTVQAAGKKTLPKDGMRELSPLNSPVFWLPYIELPLDEARVMKLDRVDGVVESQLYVTKPNGRRFVRYFIHPVSLGSPSIQRLIETNPLHVEFLATPTASPRSLVVWNPYTRDPFLLLKVSLAREVGGLRRVNGWDKGMRSITATRVFDETYPPKSHRRAEVGYMRESMVVFPPDAYFGMIVREPGPGFPEGDGYRYVPGLSILSRRPDGKAPLLVQMIRRSGRPPVEYVTEKIVLPLIRMFAELSFEHGLVGEPHQQNILLEVGPDGALTGRLVVRDMDAHKINLELRLRKGHGVRNYFPFNGPGITGDLKFTKARDYYGYTYASYLMDWKTMFGQLALYFPEKTDAQFRQEIKVEMDRLLSAEVRRHLGISVDLKTNAEAKLNRAVADFLAREAKNWIPGAQKVVSQEILREEFKRCSFNYRVHWVASSSRRALGGVTFGLHDGVIEARKGNEVIGFALLEPEGSGKKFYSGIPYPRKAPDPVRLQRLYEMMPDAPAAGLAQAERGERGWRFASEMVKGQAAGAARFGAAYVLKEGASGLLQGTFGPGWQALQEVMTPKFALSMGAFGLTSQTVEGALQTGSVMRGLARLPKPVAAVIRGGVPMAVAMNAVEALEGRRNWKQVGVTTGSFLVAGPAIDAITAPWMQAVATAHPVVRNLSVVTKLALTLGAAEGVERTWYAGERMVREIGDLTPPVKIPDPALPFGGME